MARYGAGWVSIRDRVLSSAPICRYPGCHRPATEVHHAPEYTDGESHYDYDLVPLCKRCHTRVTMGPLRQYIYLHNVIVVTGPPGSGKTTYCLAHKAAHDIIIDVDAIWAAITGEPWRIHPAESSDIVMRTSRYILDLALRAGKKIWLITTEHDRDLLDTYREAGARIIHLTTPGLVCKERVAAERRGDLDGWMLLIDEYVRGYRPGSDVQICG